MNKRKYTLCWRPRNTRRWYRHTFLSASKNAAIHFFQDWLLGCAMSRPDLEVSLRPVRDSMPIKEIPLNDRSPVLL